MGFYPKQHASRPGASQDITTGSSSATLANAFGSETYQVRLSATAAVRYRLVDGTNGGTAVSTDTLLPSGVVEYIIVTPGQKIAAIQDSAAGKLNVTEMS
jgi:hypothetical protein